MSHVYSDKDTRRVTVGCHRHRLEPCSLKTFYSRVKLNLKFPHSLKTARYLTERLVQKRLEQRFIYYNLCSNLHIAEMECSDPHSVYTL